MSSLQFNDYLKEQKLKCKNDNSPANAFYQTFGVNNKNHSNPLNNDLVFLNKNSTLTNYNTKQNEITKTNNQLKETKLLNDKKKQQIEPKLYGIRNLNIDNLVRDIKSRSSVTSETLKEDLKNEFDHFITTKVQQSQQILKKQMNKKCLLTELDNDDDDDDDDPAEEEEEEEEINLKLTEPKKENVKSLTQNNSSRALVLIAQDDNENSKSKTISLNKMMESLKRIDCPKFQPELLQVCQYGQNFELLKFYTDVIIN
jgi:hypothetical protein